MTNEPLTYDKVESAIRTAINRQEKLLEEYAHESDDLALKEAAYKLARAKAREEIRYSPITVGDAVKFPSVDAVDDAADREVTDDHAAFLTAKSKLDITRQALTTVRARLDALRTLAATHRSVT